MLTWWLPSLNHRPHASTPKFPAAGAAVKAIRQTIRRWALHHRSDLNLEKLARLYNPYICGWLNYYGHFYRSALYWTLHRIDAYPICWAEQFLQNEPNYLEQFQALEKTKLFAIICQQTVWPRARSEREHRAQSSPVPPRETEEPGMYFKLRPWVVPHDVV